MLEDMRETSLLPTPVGRGRGLGLDATELRRGEWLLARITDFTRLLWELGLDVGPGRVVELAQSLSLVDVGDPTAFYLFLKVSLVSKHEQEPIFDQAFAYFWRAAGGADAAGGASDDPRNQRRLALPAHRQRPEDKAHARPALAPGERTRHPASRLRDARRQRNVDDEDPAEQVGLFSQEEALRRKDFEDFTWAELQEARELMARMRWRLGMRQTRRLRPARRGEQLDLRNTFRRSLRSGGEPLTLLRRERRRKPRPLVILCDISGSMSLYSRLLLQFVHTVSNGLENVETFVFGTRLTRITRQLARRDVDDALADVSRIVQDWSGGTRIGESFRTFNFQWSRRALGRGAVVLVISDGWDRGDTHQLATEMARLHRNCHRLIWLNPLLGQDDYRPVTAGMRAALPYIDDFLPSHNLDSLFALGRLLEAVDDTARPARAMQPLASAATKR
ncbi:MAG TPA: VWA domain-containing protein [Ktedonobacterales bacterium]|nr:VWA domain-containing protein [Ktedonobacterales bacterium]